MKIALWTVAAGVGLILLAACGHDDNVASNSSGTGTSSGSSAPSGSAPTSSAPSDFVQFVDQQIGTDPGFNAATAVATSALTTDLQLGTANAFASVSFGTGDMVPATNYRAAVACTAAGAMLCNPAVSADLNSTLN